ncbi:MAG: hypothetical protein NT084_12015 [Bacteroidetes bacterium]|nr:hypothetical protein [Bacteroidota bacterium]
MKTKILALTFSFIGMLSLNHLQAQTVQVKQKVVVLNFDSKIPAYEPTAMGNLVRIELEKLDTFDVMDRYDVNYLVEKNALKINNCYGKICLVELGKSLGADKMLTGSVEVFGASIVYTMHLVDVKTASIELSQVTEFLNQQSEIQTMTAVMLRQLFNRSVDPNVLSQLTKPDSYDARARTPVTEKINLSGPRMGGTFFTGEAATILAAPKSQGGYKAFPLMFQFGYQFEKQYLSAGQFQALFEFIPMITGLDQGLFIPSFTVMNGLRANRRGWEFAFGPTFNLVAKDYGYYDSENNWIRRSEWNATNVTTGATPPTFVERLDSRGSYTLGSNFVFGIGKTFRSGNLNVPVNFFAIPGRSGWRFGLSFGYNSRNHATKVKYND